MPSPKTPKPSDPYWKTLPTPGLQRFVDGLPPGRYYGAKLWALWNASAHFDEDCKENQAVFRYALRKAGMVLVTSQSLLKN